MKQIWIIVFFGFALNYSNAQEDSYSKGLAYYSNGQVELAIESIKNAIKQNKENRFYPRALSIILFEKEDFRESLKYANMAIELTNATNDTDIAFRGGILFKVGKEKQAFDDFKRAYEINPSNHDYLADLGYYNAETGNYNEAIEYYNQYLNRVSNDAEAYFYRGYVYSELGYDSLAISDYHRCLQFNPDTNILHSCTKELGFQYGKQKDYDTALYYLHIAKATNVEKDITIYYYLGLAYYFSKNYEKALDNFVPYVAETDDLESMYYVGRSYDYLDMYNQAIDYYNLILQNGKNDFYKYALLRRGICYHNVMEYDKSINDLEEATEEWFESYSIGFYYLGLSLIELSRSEEGCLVLKKSLDKDLEGNVTLESNIKKAINENCSR